MCWKLVARKIQTAIWIKEVSQSCLQNNAEQMLVTICDSVDDNKPSWKTPLRNCVSDTSSEYQNPPPRPQRLSVYLESLNNIGITQEMFLADIKFVIIGG